MANQITTNQLLVVGVVAFLLFGNGFGGQQVADNGNGNGNGNGDGISGGIVPSAGCAQTPEVTLQGADKWDSGVAISVSHEYILNGGLPQTYSTAFEAGLGDTVRVLFGAGNASVYQTIKDFTVDRCENHIFIENQLVQNTSFTIQCFNEEGNVIDDTSENETVDAGDTVSLKCEIKGVFEKGMPHGGVIVAEMNGSGYDEENTMLTGDIIGGKTSVPTFYSLSDAVNKARAFEVNPILSSGNREFIFDFKADNNNDPGSAADDITLKLYSIDCFKNTETNDFECGIENEDGIQVGILAGSETIQID